MNNSNYLKSAVLKGLSLFLVLTFSVYNVSFAVPKQDAPTAAEINEILSVDDIGIAIDIGSVKSRYAGSTDKVIVHIQDAHCNYEAQTNINKMLEQLTKECGISMISVEGAEGIVDTAWFRAFPDSEIRKEVATYFMKKGEITGAEFFSIISDYEGTIFGAETKSYYIKNLKAFTEVYPYKKTMEDYFTGTQMIANRLKSMVYNPKLKRLDSRIRAFDDKKLELSDFAAYLSKTARVNAVDLSDYGDFKKLLQTLEYEEKIDFDIVDQERSTYIDALAKKMSKENMTELVAWSIRFKKGHIKAVDFYSFLRELAREYDIPIIQEYPNLFYYYVYTKLYDGIDNETLFKEIGLVKKRLKKEFFQDQTQEKLDKYSEMLDMFVDLINIELTNDDYDIYKEYSNEFSIEDVLSFLRTLCNRYNLGYTFDEVPPLINKNIPHMVDFYEIAMKRDDVIINNTLKRMEKEGKDRCVLIAGGFHTRGIKNLLEEKGISYVVVTPKITKDVETPYIKVLTNQRTSLEDIITESAVMPGVNAMSGMDAVKKTENKLLSPLLRFGFLAGLYVNNPKKLKRLSDDIAFVVDQVQGAVPLEELAQETVEEAVRRLVTEQVQEWSGTAKPGEWESALNPKKRETLLSAFAYVWSLGHERKYKGKKLPEVIRDAVIVEFNRALSPGTETVRTNKIGLDDENDLYESLTPEQMEALDSVIARLMHKGEHDGYTLRYHDVVVFDENAKKLREDRMEIVLLKGFREAIEGYSAGTSDPALQIPMDVRVHPGTGKGQWVRMYLDERDYEALTEQQRRRLAEHEYYHIINPTKSELDAIAALNDNLMDVRNEFDKIERERLRKKGEEQRIYNDRAHDIFERARSVLSEPEEDALAAVILDAFNLAVENRAQVILGSVINLMDQAIRADDGSDTPIDNIAEEAFTKTAEKVPLWIRKDLMESILPSAEQMLDRWFGASDANIYAQDKEIVTVIMAGGGGERLYPISTLKSADKEGGPKQLAKVLDKPLLLMSVERVIRYIGAKNVYIQTIPEHKDRIFKLLQDYSKTQGNEAFAEIPKYNIFTEPKAADTAGAIGYAAAMLIKLGRGDVTMFVQTADHFIDVESGAFRRAYKAVSQATRNNPVIGAIGIDMETIGASSEYGTVVTGKGTFQKSKLNRPGISLVSKFKEKPPVEVAQSMIDANRRLKEEGQTEGITYYNTGMYFGTPKTWLTKFEELAPEYGKLFRDISKEGTTRTTEEVHFAKMAEWKIDKRTPEGRPAGPIDMVLSELMDDLVIVGGEFVWQDIGGFKAIYEYYMKNYEGDETVWNSNNNIVVDEGDESRDRSSEKPYSGVENLEGSKGNVIISGNPTSVKLINSSNNLIMARGAVSEITLTDVNDSIVIYNPATETVLIAPLKVEGANIKKLLAAVAEQDELKGYASGNLYENTLAITAKTLSATKDGWNFVFKSGMGRGMVSNSEGSILQVQTGLGLMLDMNDAAHNNIVASVGQKAGAEEITEIKVKKYSVAKIDDLESIVTKKYAEVFGIDEAQAKTKLAEIKAARIFADQAKKAKSAPETLQTAKDNLRKWLTGGQFREYQPALIALIDLAKNDQEVAKELYDSFWRTIPFGTGGRRWRIGIGPNRMNAYMAAMTAQGHVEYLKSRYAVEIGRGDAVVGAWDVREFHKYYAETPGLAKYREVIDQKCPVLTGLSSEDLSKVVGLVYAGNGIKYVHSTERRSTPWLSFLVNRFSYIDNSQFDNSSSGTALAGISNIMAGIVLSSSHNPYDNNGTKFYENSGAQAPPEIVQQLMDLGDSVTVINYSGNDLIYEQGLEEAFRQAVEDGNIITLEGKNLAATDTAYIEAIIKEIRDLYTPEQWKKLEPHIEETIVSFSSINGTGDTNVTPAVVAGLGARMIKHPGDVPTWEFPLGYGNIPNPEVEKTFNTAMEIGIRRTLDWMLVRKTPIEAVIDEEGVEISMASIESELGHAVSSVDELLAHVMETRGKFVRGIKLAVDDSTEREVRDFCRINNICLMTDPDADRVGLGMLKMERRGDTMSLLWVSANDNDESGIILFRYHLEKRLEMAEREPDGEALIRYIEERRPKSKSGKYQIVMVNTVVSNPLERKIADIMSGKIERATGGRVTVKTVTHHVGFKFTGEIIDIINKGEFTGITGEVMKKVGVNLEEAFFGMSFEEGEGGLIGSDGSVDKDSGVIGVALTVLDAELLAEGKTMHDYLMETYRKYGYSKTYLEPMVMTGEYGFTMINEKIMKHLREVVLPQVNAGDEVKWGKFVLKGGIDHYDLVKAKYGDDPAQWDQAVREAVNILEFYAEVDGVSVTIVARPSGTEPKHKNTVMTVGPEMSETDDLAEYITRIDGLNRAIMDEVMIACYYVSGAEYESKVQGKPGVYRVAALSREDKKELLKIFPIVVSIEVKLAVYFPLRDWIREQAQSMVGMEPAQYRARYDELRESIEAYLVNFKTTDGVQFVEEAVLLNLTRQMAAAEQDDNNALESIRTQAILWFGEEIGEGHYKGLITERTHGIITKPDADAPQGTPSPGANAVRTNFGVEVNFTEDPGIGMAAAMVLGVESFERDQLDNVIEALFRLRPWEQLNALMGVTNALTEVYADLPGGTDREEVYSRIRRFYSGVIENAVDVKNVGISHGLQIMSGQAMNILYWIDSGHVPGAQYIEVTASLGYMLRSTRGPSYLKTDTLPTGATQVENTKGVHYRGVEGPVKLKENLLMALEDKDYNMLMYLMMHGVIAVPAGLSDMTDRGLISTFHRTIFLSDFLRDSSQHTSTGPGHFQMKTLPDGSLGVLLDIKQVTAGTGYQHNKFYKVGPRGPAELKTHLIQPLAPGSLTVSLPGAVDSMDNLGGLEFDDFSIVVPIETASAIVEAITGESFHSLLGFSGRPSDRPSEVRPPRTIRNERMKEELMRAGRIIAAKAAEMPYLAARIGGRTILVENGPTARDEVKSFDPPRTILGDFPTLSEAYYAATPGDIRDMVDKIADHFILVGRSGPEFRQTNMGVIKEGRAVKAQVGIEKAIRNVIPVARDVVNGVTASRDAVAEISRHVGKNITIESLQGFVEFIGDRPDLGTVFYGAPAVEIANAIRLVQLVVLNTEPAVMSRRTDTQYDWKGKSNGVRYGKDAAELWFSSSVIQKGKDRNPSTIPGTKIKIGYVSLGDITLREMYEAAPGFIGDRFKNKPTFTKSLNTRFANKIHMGFNKKITKPDGREKFTQALIRERNNVDKLKAALISGLPRDEFEQYLEAYEQWTTEKANLQWVGTTSTMEQARVIMGSYLNLTVEEILNLFHDIAETRAEIVSYFNEIDLDEVDKEFGGEDYAILSPAGHPHSIFGLSHQTHPMKPFVNAKGETEYPKNEAWIIVRVGDDKILMEPQQTSDNTYSFADFYTPIVWRENAPEMRKEGNETIIRGFVERGLRTDISTTPDDFIRPAGKTNIPGSTVTGDATVRSLVRDTIPDIWEEQFFMVDLVTLNGLQAAKVELDAIEYARDLVVYDGTAVISVVKDGIERQFRVDKGNSLSVAKGADVQITTEVPNTKVLIVYGEENAYKAMGLTPAETTSTRVVSRGPIGDTGQHEYLEEVEIDKDKSTFVADSVQIIGTDPVAPPKVIGARSHKVRLRSGRVTIRDTEGSAIRDLDYPGRSVVLLGSDYTIVNRDATQPAVLEFVEYDKNPEEDTTYALYSMLQLHVAALKGKKVILHMPKSRFVEGGKNDVGSLGWTKEMICRYTSTKSGIRTYDDSRGLDDLDKRNPQESAIDVLIASEDHLKAAMDSGNEKIISFINSVRNLPLRHESLSIDAEKFFVIETAAWGLIASVVTMDQVNDGLAADETSPAAHMYRLVRYVFGKEDFRWQDLYYMLPFEEITMSRGDIVDAYGEISGLYNMAKWMNMLVNKFLPPIRAFAAEDVADEWNQRRKVMWAV